MTDWIAPPNELATVTTLHMMVGSSGAAADELLQTQIDEYVATRNANTTNDGAASRINIELKFVPQYTRSLLAALAGDAPPDLFLIDTFTLPKIVADGGLYPLTGGNSDPLPSALLDDLYPEVQSAFSLDDQLYCLPREYTTLALVYNPALFDVAGIPYPSASWGWQELADAAQQITEAPNDFYSTVGMVLDADFSRWLPFLHQVGGSVTDVEGQVMTIDSAAALESLEFYLGLNLDGYAIEPSDLTSSWSGEAFGTGRIGMIIEGSWIVGYLDNEYPTLNYGVSPLPQGPAQNATVLFGNCYGIGANSPHQIEASELALYLTGAGPMARWQAVSNLLPARISLEEQMIADNPTIEPFLEGLPYAVPWQFPPGFEAMVDAVNGSMGQVFDAEIDAAEVLRVGGVIGTDILENQ